VSNPYFSAVALAALAAGTLFACSKSPPEPTAEPAPDNARTSPGDAGKFPLRTMNSARRPERPAAPPKGKVVALPVATVPVSPDDPLHGKFTLEDATKGLPPGKQLSASIETSMGKLECKLFDDKAPITVANFVGLARGSRPWKTPDGTWADKKPAYEGTIFHRIIKGFMIQGGDAKKDGSGEAGYVIPDEVWEGGSHDRPGLLCMANRGKNTNSAQFFITDEAALNLDNGYTIFGECGPVELIHQLASVPVSGSTPKTPLDIKKIVISRK
jgi:peptidyl-prolyl cis-trans isomerase A (cyclophilin A)